VQIVALDLGCFDLFCDIEPMLRPLADSRDALAVAKGQMFLALVRHVRASGPEPRMVGTLLLDELHLRPLGGRAPTTVTIRPDSYDFGPREGDMPRMHYRVNIRTPDRALSRDIRTQDLERVERALREAFGWDS
jgi:hypothetical protein